MSSTELMLINADGLAEPFREYKNSWGGAAHVWTALCTRYNTQQKPGDWEDMGGWKSLWAAVKEKPRLLEDYELLVLYFTYDNAMVKREDFDDLADALDKFYDRHHDPKRVDHIKAWADDLRILPDEHPGVQAICLHATSVSENPWYDWDDEAEEDVAYNINTGNKHWFVGEPEGDD